MLDISPFWNSWVVPLVALLAVGLGMYIIAKSGAWLDAHAKFLDASRRQRLMDLEQRAIDAGVAFVINYTTALGGKIVFSVDNPVLRHAAQIAMDHGAGFLNDHGADPALVAGKILANLPPAVVSTDTTGVEISPPEHIAVQPLQPIGKTA